MSAASSARGAPAPLDSLPPASALREQVARAVRRYLADLDGHADGALLELVMREVETPLYGEVMRHFDDNQSRAAEALGINRATLRKRLRELGLYHD